MNVRLWLGTLAPRERRLVYIAAGLAIIGLLYAGVALPLRHAHAKQVARVEKKTEDLAWMRQAAPQVAAIASRRSASGNESLVVLVDRAGHSSGLAGAVRDAVPNGQNSLRLRLEGAPFDTMIAWLVGLQQMNGVSVSDATIDAASAPGLVNATITLTHGASTAP